MVQICNIRDCQCEVFKSQEQCILHCEKHSYYDDFDNSGLFRKFYDELARYIAEFIFEWTFRELNNVTPELLKAYLEGHSIEEDEFFHLCKKEKIIFDGIFFPCRDSRDRFDYFNILKKIGGAHFNSCKFSLMSCDLSDLAVFYQDCEFTQSWAISNTKILDNVNNVIYQNCIFKDKVQVFRWDNEDGLIDYSLFYDCSFEVALNLHEITFKSMLFNNSNKKQVIPFLWIDNCAFEQNFILNNLVAESFKIVDTLFLSKVELKSGEIREFTLGNTNFNGLFDAYSSKFGEFKVFKSIFSEFVGFELCKFSLFKGNSISNDIATFQYTTFLSFTNFRNTIFYGGLNLEDANLKEPPNFLNIELKSNNTNRETLRIIKYSFDKIGNHIEANKFFVLEMKKYKEELFQANENKKENRWKEKIVYLINEYISDFGSNYFLSVFWILVSSSIYYLLVFLHKKDKVNMGISFLDDIAKSMIPFKAFLESGMEFISLIFYIIFATLIWQTIVAVKRYTKR